MKITELEKKVGNFSLYIKDLTMEDKIIHGVIGNNGSGKSTLLKLIAGIIKPDAGTIDFGSYTLQDITITSQSPYMIRDTVLNNLKYPLKIRKLKMDEDEIMEWIRKCGLSGKEKQYAPSLSSGERQKLSFARALIFKPKVVLVDETLANLDPDSVNMFEEIMKEIQSREPITWILVSHQLAHIYRMCQKIHVMEKGSVISSGTPEDIFYRNDNPIVKQYLSNFLIGNEL